MRYAGVRVTLLLVVGGLVSRGRLLSAQELQLADRGPRFLAGSGDNLVPLDVDNAPALQRRVTLEFDRVPLEAALGQITRQAHIRFGYSKAVVDAEAKVSLHADHITVAAALFELLMGTGLDVRLSRDGTAGLIPRAGAHPRARQGVGQLAGRVTDAATLIPLEQVAVRVEGPGLGATTALDGRYLVRNIPSGTYRVTVRRVGYASLTKTVTITAESAATADFALTQTVATLEQVVTTGAGLQRRVELGNAIATIDADSVVRTAPVTNLTDVISGRMPGVDVVQTSGMAGSGPAIRIRGRGSVTLSNDPIYIVDGVRVDGAPGGQADAFVNFGYAAINSPTPSRLNDIDPDEIASIEVLRGPSASTEYGTDAANGVVVITTKRGRAGAPRWSVTAEEGLSTMPAHFPDNYYSWGHTTNGTNTPTECPLVASNPFFNIPGSTTGQCVVDSVTRFQPLNHSETSLFGTGTRGHYALQVSGGGTQMQYFLGGGLTSEIGVLQMPPTEAARLERERQQAIPRDQLRPNAFDNESVRGRATTGLGSLADVSINASYVNTGGRSPNAEALLLNALTSPGIRDTLSGYGGGYGGANSFGAPGAVLANTGSEGVNRFTGGTSGMWRPTGWFVGRATVGLDAAGRTDEVLVLPGQGTGVAGNPGFTTFGLLGYRSVGLYQTDLYTADVGATATAALSQWASAKTAVGVQYNDRRTHGSATAVANLALGNPTLNGATVLGQLEQRDEAATLGSYVEETIGLSDRLFLVGAVRVDAGSGFGTAYKAAVYPKASLSWLVLPEGANTTLRLRAAYGQSGVQPPAGGALQLFVPGQTYYVSGTVPNALVSSVGSPGLKPERTEEIESGFDLGFLGGRLTAEATAYAKLSHDALVSLPLPGSVGIAAQLINLGSVSNRGIELSLTARVLEARAAQWDVTVSGSDNENRLVTLGPGVPPIDQTSFFRGPYKQTPGFPLYGLWAFRIHYQDLNHDGIIEPNEVTQDAAPSYVGPSLAPRQLSVSTGVTVLGGHIRVAGQLDYRGGQYLMHLANFFADATQDNRATNDPHAPLASQARAVESIVGLGNISTAYLEPASFTRLRELSLTYYGPSRLAAAVHARTLSVTVAGRNLGLWTKYTGPDPEVNTTAGGNQVLSPGGLPTTALNPDIVGDAGSVPQVRYWTLKLNLGL